MDLSIKVFRKIGYSFLGLAKRIENRNENGNNETAVRQAKEIKKWFRDKGDETLRLNYSLGPESVVFDLGGYKGQWSSDIYSKYKCKIYIFEPFLSFHEIISSRFKSNSDILTFPFGLGAKNEEVNIFPSDDGTSIFNISNEDSDGIIVERIKIVAFDQFLQENAIKKIDLLKINIEGAEFDLLDHILDSGVIDQIENLQIQFHNKYIEDPKERMEQIQKRLSNTHKLSWQYWFVWENWKRKC